MSLSPGSQVGPYEITGALGAGGMGEVYRARDRRLQRSVAIKVLPDGFAADPQRLARFEREAQALAALSHPNIGAIFGFQESDGIHALVLELVEGPTLAERITHGPLPLADASAIGLQIADALEAAHDQGIVHRDLKPANIKVRDDGTVKVLDFGLAKMLDPASTSSPDLTASPTVVSPANMTEAGIILGTAAYMSPEQAKGRPADKRSDVWAFGCVLYEMLTGRRAFEGEHLSDIIAAVLRGEPDWKALPGDVPVAVRRLLECCLDKDRAKRVHDISTARFVLSEAVGRSGVPAIAAEQRSSWRSSWIALVTGALGIAAGALAALGLHPVTTGSRPLRVARFELPISTASPLSTSTFGADVAISPDGSRIVYMTFQNGVRQLVVRNLDGLEPHVLAGTEGGADPFFSPDGQQIGFIASDELRRVPVGGGSSVVIWHGDPTFSGASWAADDTIVFGYDFGLFRVGAAGGQAEKIADPDPGKDENAYDRPIVLPGGQAIVYTVTYRSGATAIAARRLGGGGAIKLVDHGIGPLFASSGYLVYGQSGRLMAVRFDPSALTTSGAPFVAQDDVYTKSVASDAALAGDGTAVYVAGQYGVSRSHLGWVDRHGARVGTPVSDALDSPRNVRLSPDGRRLALTVGSFGAANIWIYDVESPGRPLQLTFHDHNTFPVWSPDGRKIAFMSVAGAAFQVLSIASDGSTAQTQTLVAAGKPSVPVDWSPDGRFIVMHRQASLWLFDSNGGKVAPFLEAPFSEYGARISPDGRWLAYASNQAGLCDVWVRPFPASGAPVRVSSSGGHDPVWSSDGRELFFTNGAKLMSARILSTSPVFDAEEPRELFEGGFKYDTEDLVLRYFDVARDGRFLMVEPSQKGVGTVVVAPHWDELLKTH